MGQKTSPTGFRLVFNRRWKSVWFANKQETSNLLAEDKKIRDYLLAKPCCAGTSSITIKRMSGKMAIPCRGSTWLL